MSDSKDKHGSDEDRDAISQLNSSAKPMRAYSPPRVRSVERLEAAAAVCTNPPTGGFGKFMGGAGGCSVLGS